MTDVWTLKVDKDQEHGSGFVVYLHPEGIKVYHMTYIINSNIHNAGIIFDDYKEQPAELWVSYEHLLKNGTISV